MPAFNIKRKSSTILISPNDQTSLMDLMSSVDLFEESEDHLEPTTSSSKQNPDAALIANLENLLRLFDGSERSRREVYEAYSKVYDKRITAIVFPKGSCFQDYQNPRRRVEMDFDQYFDNIFWHYAQLRTPFSKTWIRPDDRQKGVLHYYVQNDSFLGHKVTVHICAWYSADEFAGGEAKISLIEFADLTVHDAA